MSRKIININKNWSFRFENNDRKEINIPHTFNAHDTIDCSMGTGYYRKDIFLEKSMFLGKCIFIQFGGVNNIAEVFVNGRLVGIHEGGYSLFRFDITDFVKLDDNNYIEITADNRNTTYIAPINGQGDFTKMGGIYRDVDIIAVNPLHIAMNDFGSNGVFVTPENISANHADVTISVKIENNSEIRKAIVRAKIYDDNSSFTTETDNIELKSNCTEITLETAITDPVLWNGAVNPHLYNIDVELICNGDVIDKVSDTFGIRNYSITKNDGFILNGSYVDLHGVNYHQDSYENGWAMSGDERERDYNIMSELGCNIVRMAHYQHCRQEYELCDRLGFAVWAEIGIVNEMGTDSDSGVIIDERFEANATRQLIELIRQNYNHPSIIVWGISNELHQMSDKILEIYSKLCKTAKAEDNSRLTTYADNQFWGNFRNLPTDVVGCNRYFGWYKDAGSADKFGEWLDDYNSKIAIPLCVSEYGGGGAISQHKDNIDWETEIDPWGERHYENYQSAMHEKIWEQFSVRKYLWAKIIWCMFDFSSVGRKEGDTIGQNDKGLCTRERVRKDVFWFYKSVWNSEPMVHITDRRFSERTKTIPNIKVYSNADKVTLYLNGKETGTIDKASLSPINSTVFVWNDIVLSDGENIAEAKAEFTDGTVKTDTVKWLCK